MQDIIYIAGATGLIGTNLARKLNDKGYKIGAISRSANGARKLLPFLSSVIETDYKDDALKDELEGAAAVINLAGASIAGKRWNDKYKELIYSSRIDTTRSLVNAINQCTNKPNVFISTSAVGYYGESGDKILSENESAGSDFLAKVCEEWEKEAHKSNVRNVIGRIGVVLSMEDGALPKMLPPFKMFAGGALGNGKQWFPWIHIDDLTNMFIWFLENDNCMGAYNLSSPGIVTNSEFSKAIGRTLKRPSFLNAPEFAIKLILGESADFILSSLRAVPDKAQKEGFEFQYDTIDIALFDLLK
jgi:uncharacterized protein (TIGR01777 family)